MLSFFEIRNLSNKQIKTNKLGLINKQKTNEKKKKKKAFPICLDHANSFGNSLSKNIFLPLLKKRGPEHCFCRFLKNTVPCEFLLLKLYIFIYFTLLVFKLWQKVFSQKVTPVYEQSPIINREYAFLRHQRSKTWPCQKQWCIQHYLRRGSWGLCISLHRYQTKRQISQNIYLHLSLCSQTAKTFSMPCIKVSAFIGGGGNFNIRWTPSWTHKIDPFNSFCSLTPLMMQTIQYITHLWKTTPVTRFF